MTAGPATPPTVSTSKRVATVGGQALGIGGIVVCIVLIVGVVLGRGWAIDQVDSVSASIDAQLAKVPPLLAEADAAVTNVQAKVSVVSDAAAAVAAVPNPAPALRETFQSAIAAVSDRYLPLRTKYADARANIVSTLDRLETLDRIVPGITIPTGPTDTLATLDARIQELDASVMAILDTASGATPIADAATAVATKTADVVTKLDGLHATIGELETKLAETQAKLDSAANTISTVITLLSLVLVLVLLYGIFLHVILFRTARGASPKPATPAA
jgi:hypothetical protein